LRLEPDNAIAHQIDGEILVTLKQPEKALEAFETAISLDRNLATAYAWRGNVKSLLDRPDETFADIERAMQLSPRDTDLWLWFNFMGFAWEWTGRPEEAIAAFGRAARLQPVNILAYVNLAGLLANLGREDEARVNLNKTLEQIQHFQSMDFVQTPIR
jgi:tetratricopeptide (TPR) repeat protein